MPTTDSASRARPRRAAIVAQEDRAWVSFYQRVRSDPAIAEEVLTQLDADVLIKREHLALYLCCRESLRLHQARQMRNRRIGQFVRWVFGGIFIELPIALRRALGRGGDIVDACLPDAVAEPATAQLQRLASSPKVRAARTPLKAQAKAQPPAPAPMLTPTQQQAA